MLKTQPPIALQKLKDLVFPDLVYVALTVYREGKAYSACSFQIDEKTVEFRASKITPKKIGQFVAIWKRDAGGITQPFDVTDDIDYIIIACATDERFGAFVFPKSVLIAYKIISVNGTGGKRGIRVYPTWDIANNPQSKKTQVWQSKYFIDEPTLNYFL